MKNKDITKTVFIWTTEKQPLSLDTTWHKDSVLSKLIFKLLQGFNEVSDTFEYTLLNNASALYIQRLITNKVEGEPTWNINKQTDWTIEKRWKRNKSLLRKWLLTILRVQSTRKESSTVKVPPTLKLHSVHSKTQTVRHRLNRCSLSTLYLWKEQGLFGETANPRVDRAIEDAARMYQKVKST